MRTPRKYRRTTMAVATLVAFSSPISAGERTFLPNMLPFPNASGMAATYSTNGSIDMTGPFFQSLGTNGRRCVTCHQPDEGWSVTPAGLRARFAATSGTDPIFRTNDGATSPNADVSTTAKRREAYAMLLDKGLIRVGIGIPQNAEFDLVRRRSVRLRECNRAVALQARAASDQSPVPKHHHVGRARDLRGSGFPRLHPGDDALLRIPTLQPRRSVEQRDERACAGQRAADHRAAQRDRRVRDRVAYRTDLRRRRRHPDGARRARRAEGLERGRNLFRHQRRRLQ